MTDDGERHDPLERARGLGSTDEARELYDRWAPTYDDDVFERMGVTGSRRVAELFAATVDDRSTAIIDLGCGTGAVGRHLADAGFDDLTGVDLSKNMLRLARQNGVYRDLVAADLDDPPTFDRRFGGSVSAGTFTTGHVTATAVAGLVALLRPGATIVWAVHPTLWPSISSALEAAGVRVVSSHAEAIRTGTDDRSHMVIGVVRE